MARAEQPKREVRVQNRPGTRVWGDSAEVAWSSQIAPQASVGRAWWAHSQTHTDRHKYTLTSDTQSCTGVQAALTQIRTHTHRQRQTQILRDTYNTHAHIGQTQADTFIQKQACLKRHTCTLIFTHAHAHMRYMRIQ